MDAHLSRIRKVVEALLLLILAGMVLLVAFPSIALARVVMMK